MSTSPTDWQCCMDTPSGLRCTRALIYDGHDGPCEHEHDYRRAGRNKEETICGCEPANGRYVIEITRPDGVRVFMARAGYMCDGQCPDAEVCVMTLEEALYQSRIRLGMNRSSYEVVPALPQHTRRIVNSL